MTESRNFIRSRHRHMDPATSRSRFRVMTDTIRLPSWSFCDHVLKINLVIYSWWMMEIVTFLDHLLIVNDAIYSWWMAESRNITGYTVWAQQSQDHTFASQPIQPDCQTETNPRRTETKSKQCRHFQRPSYTCSVHHGYYHKHFRSEAFLSENCFRDIRRGICGFWEG